MDDHVAANRASWDANAEGWAEAGRERWADAAIRWGTWDVPEEKVQLLPDVDGLDVVELGCGTGYMSSWLARRGAHAVGLDNSGNNWRLRRSSSASSRFRSRWCTAMRSARRSGTTRSIWPSASTARSSGAIRTAGSQKRRGCFEREAASCAWATRTCSRSRSPTMERRRRSRCNDRISGCTDSSTETARVAR